jgi:hypothetical protein
MRATRLVSIGTASPSVFDADLPTLDYDLTTTPAQLYPQLLAAHRQAPIAMGPFGPEILSQELARFVLRDRRFQMPPGLNLAMQGITSGPLWDKVVNSLIGANLARVELAEALKAVTGRIACPRRTGPAPWKPMTSLSGPTSLPIAWDV